MVKGNSKVRFGEDRDESEGSSAKRPRGLRDLEVGTSEVKEDEDNTGDHKSIIPLAYISDLATLSGQDIELAIPSISLNQAKFDIWRAFDVTCAKEDQPLRAMWWSVRGLTIDIYALRHEISPAPRAGANTKGLRIYQAYLAYARLAEDARLASNKDILMKLILKQLDYMVLCLDSTHPNRNELKKLFPNLHEDFRAKVERVKHLKVRCGPQALLEGSGTGSLVDTVRPALNADISDLKSFAAIIGHDRAKGSLRDAIEMSVRWPYLDVSFNGILLYGPPGTGKTSLAEAVAAETKCRLYRITSNSVMSRWVGDSEKAIQSIFDAARINKPAIIFIDEAESFCSVRPSQDGELIRRLKAKLLIHMDRLEPGVVVVAATNVPWNLDDAFLRCEEKLLIGLPTHSEIIALFEHYLPPDHHTIDRRDLTYLALLGMTGDDVKIIAKKTLRNMVGEITKTTRFTLTSLHNEPRYVPSKTSKGPTMSDVIDKEMIFPRSITTMDLKAVADEHMIRGMSQMAAHEDWARSYGYL